MAIAPTVIIKAAIQLNAMTTAVQTHLDSFENLSTDEQWTLVSTLLHRTLHLDLPPLNDEELTQTADDLFLMFDAEENGN